MLNLYNYENYNLNIFLISNDIEIIGEKRNNIQVLVGGKDNNNLDFDNIEFFIDEKEIFIREKENIESNKRKKICIKVPEELVLTGEINLKRSNLTLEYITLKCNIISQAGYINIKNCDIQEDSSIKLNFGDVNIKDSMGFFNVITNIGAIKIENSEILGLFLQNNNGNIFILGNFYLKKRSMIKALLGDIDIHIIEKNDFEILKNSTGENNISLIVNALGGDSSIYYKDSNEVMIKQNNKDSIYKVLNIFKEGITNLLKFNSEEIEIVVNDKEIKNVDYSNFKTDVTLI